MTGVDANANVSIALLRLDIQRDLRRAQARALRLAFHGKLHRADIAAIRRYKGELAVLKALEDEIQRALDAGEDL